MKNQLKYQLKSLIMNQQQQHQQQYKKRIANAMHPIKVHRLKI